MACCERQYFYWRKCTAASPTFYTGQGQVVNTHFVMTPTPCSLSEGDLLNGLGGHAGRSSGSPCVAMIGMEYCTFLRLISSSMERGDKQPHFNLTLRK